MLGRVSLAHIMAADLNLDGGGVISFFSFFSFFSGWLCFPAALVWSMV